MPGDELDQSQSVDPQRKACRCRKVDGILGTKVLTTPGSEDRYPERILNGHK
jgi:hypothetical protein